MLESDKIIHTKVDKAYGFTSIFNDETGYYMRGEMPNGQDPFMASYPELLDIGVMGSCENGLQGKCLAGGIECYQSGKIKKEPHMSLQDFESIIEQSEGKLFQVALGGRGDPNNHPDFESLLKTCRNHSIVPNYTTSGLTLTDKEIELTKEYCGAVAVSEHRQPYTKETIDRFLDAKMTTNLHYVLGKHTIDEAIEKLQNGFYDGINAVVFLLHKPVGMGQYDKVLSLSDMEEFFRIINKADFNFKIGFDSCTIPGVLNRCDKIDEDSVDTCEGARFSAYITPSMQMLPCSFDQNKRWAVNLYENSIEEAWNSLRFQDFRDIMTFSCPNCEDKKLCYGSCPVEREIVLCDRVEKELVTKTEMDL